MAQVLTGLIIALTLEMRWLAGRFDQKASERQGDPRENRPHVFAATGLTIAIGTAAMLFVGMAKCLRIVVHDEPGSRFDAQVIVAGALMSCLVILFQPFLYLTSIQRRLISEAEEEKTRLGNILASRALFVSVLGSMVLVAAMVVVGV